MNGKIMMLITRALRLLLCPLKLLPVNSKIIVFTSYCGRQLSCNPKYIYEELLGRNTDFQIIWAFTEPEKYLFLKEYGIKVVKYNSFSFILYCIQSKYIITNVRDLYHIPFRPGQHVINTWHGGGAYKKVGTACNNAGFEERQRMAIGKSIPYTYISSSQIFTQTTLRDSFDFDGPILSCGMPRNDRLVNFTSNGKPSKIHDYLNLPHHTKLLLYAPTYRADKSPTDYSFHFQDILVQLKSRFHGEWVILFRTHYYIAQSLSLNEPCTYDVSQYSDMQELLLESDILVTDYSSCMWDFSLTMKPCFLYATDLASYNLTDGFYTDIHTWPFPLTRNSTELQQALADFDQDLYEKKVRSHHLLFGSHETGNAAKTVVDYILSV